MKCEEAQELITALVDDEITTGERAALKEHFESCSSCQLVYNNQLALKNAVHRAGADVTAPPALRESIIRDARILGPKPDRFAPRRASRFHLRPALATAALLALLVLPVLYLIRPEAKPLALMAIEVHEKIAGGEMSFIRGGNAEETKQMLYRSVGGAFAPMTYDMADLNLKPVGGAVFELHGRKVLITVYQGSGLTLTCYTFLGTESDEPASAERFYDAVRKINYYLYARGATHAVLHREGNLVCILSSSLPVSQLLELARSGA